MKELFEVYTKNNNKSKEAFLKLKEEYGRTIFANWEQAARYVLQNDNGANLLVELDFPTALANTDKEVWLNAYEFDGDIEDYTAEYEVACEVYDGDFTNVYEDMKQFAIKNFALLKL